VGRSLTKILGIPGIRLGYGVANRKIISYLKQAQMPWSVNNLARGIAERISEFDGFIRGSVSMIEKEREYLIKRLSEIDGIKIYPSFSNYIMFSLEGLASRTICDEMRENDILVRRCDSFRGGGPNDVRIAIRNREENEKLLSAMLGLYGKS
jgi:threonine-phosphate decarboxylase